VAEAKGIDDMTSKRPAKETYIFMKRNRKRAGGRSQEDRRHDKIVITSKRSQLPTNFMDCFEIRRIEDTSKKV